MFTLYDEQCEIVVNALRIAIDVYHNDAINCSNQRLCENFTRQANEIKAIADLIELESK